MCELENDAPPAGGVRSGLDRRDGRARGAGRLVMPSTAAVLQGLLRLSPGEAKSRVAATRAGAPRANLTGQPLPAVRRGQPLPAVRRGQPLPAVRPTLAGAQTDGTVSAEHTRMIRAVLHACRPVSGMEDQSLAEKHLPQ